MLKIRKNILYFVKIFPLILIGIFFLIYNIYDIPFLKELASNKLFKQTNKNVAVLFDDEISKHIKMIYITNDVLSKGISIDIMYTDLVMSDENKKLKLKNIVSYNINKDDLSKFSSMDSTKLDSTVRLKLLNKITNIVNLIIILGADRYYYRNMEQNEEYCCFTFDMPHKRIYYSKNPIENSLFCKNSQKEYLLYLINEYVYCEF